MSDGPRLLRARLTALVYRDAAASYRLGLAIVLLPMVYLLQAWPPSDIRSTIRSLATWPRIELLVLVHASYLFATHGLVRQLLASARLAWWRQLPLTSGWWRSLHLRHLLLLNTPWLLAAGYGVWPLIGEGRAAAALAWLLGVAGLTLASQVALVAAAGRWWWLLALGLGSAGSFASALLAGPWVAASLGAAALAWAATRLGAPMAEPRHSRRGRWHRSGAVLALIRLAARAVARRDAVALAWGLALQLSLVAIAALAFDRAGDRAIGLARGLAVVAAVFGAAVLPRALRILDGDRPLLDSWGLSQRLELRARLGFAALGGVPALISGVLLTGPYRLSWLLDSGVAIGWAAILSTCASAAAETRRDRYKPQIGKTLLRMTLGAAAVSLVGSVLVLIPWALVELARLPTRYRRAQVARQRFEPLDVDDHG